MTAALHHFTRVEFSRFKAFRKFDLRLRHFNMLVGPNNAGKSTILAAFRILASAQRRASARNAEIVSGPLGQSRGYRVDLKSVSIAEENIFYNYDDSEPATVRFHISNGNSLLLFFEEPGSCNMIVEAQGKQAGTPTSFKSQFNCPIGFVPILGPVDHAEYLFDKEAARIALNTYSASRNFRNIWYHYPEHFDYFKSELIRTWPGMDVDKPVVDRSHEKPRLFMFCPEQRFPREIFWAGFGFQVWCQMLTHLIQSREKSLFLIDEPDIYLHSDLQRQLLQILRDLGPDILIATHSTELISEAETDDILLINKKYFTARRIRKPADLHSVFSSLGSNLNPILTQLAKTKRVVFVEGKDFQILGRFARKIGADRVSNRSDFAVIPVDGFNPDRIRVLKSGIEATLGAQIAAAAILDRDYRSDAEREEIASQCETFCSYVSVHSCKEVENFLLVPEAIDRACERRIADRSKRSGHDSQYVSCASDLLAEFAARKRSYVAAQILDFKARFEKERGSGLHRASANEVALAEFEQNWASSEHRWKMVPGKEALSFLNVELQQRYRISITATSVIDAMRMDEIPQEMAALINSLKNFSQSPVPSS